MPLTGLPPRASFKRKITAQDVEAFAALCGDSNPLHVDEKFAAATRFGKRVVHGMLLASLFSQMVGKHLGTPNVLYVSQSLEFRSPVFIGEEVEVEFALKSHSQSAGLATYGTTIRKGATVCVCGTARIALL